MGPPMDRGAVSTARVPRVGRGGAGVTLVIPSFWPGFSPVNAGLIG